MKCRRYCTLYKSIYSTLTLIARLAVYTVLLKTCFNHKSNAIKPHFFILFSWFFRFYEICFILSKKKFIASWLFYYLFIPLKETEKKRQTQNKSEAKRKCFVLFWCNRYLESNWQKKIETKWRCVGTHTGIIYCIQYGVCARWKRTVTGRTF